MCQSLRWEIKLILNIIVTDLAVSRKNSTLKFIKITIKRTSWNAPGNAIKQLIAPDS